jgi:phosphoribosyl-ATP pyrophosphohydrolase/phosphoribosyl-AMP cyclohydrolase
MGLDALKFGSDGLITVVIQDRLTGELRMVGYANEVALQRTLDTGECWFWSRSRSALWRKGESSGHVLHVREVWTDCDGDAVVYMVDPEGPTCHTGRTACFFRVLERDGTPREDERSHAQAALPRLWSELVARAESSAERSYTRKLLDGGPEAIGAKLREEADELARAVQGESHERVVSEAADVLYHLLVGLLSRGATLAEVESELARRSGTSGLDEKRSRSSGA